jgi:hypothetical protein
MGLLDDAIREHLELKRRSGADPGAIARAEHEALDPIFPAEAPLEDLHSEPAAAAETTLQAGEPAAPAVHASDDPAAAEASDFSSIGQETAELDMATVLETDPGTDQPHPARAVSTSEDAAEEELEWEVAGSHQEPVPEEIPGQERLTFE